MTSVLIGASRVEHIEDAVNALENRTFAASELTQIDHALEGS
jgi:aryl-alcohol dehydrogenase-like predicted oxidoreductase